MKKNMVILVFFVSFINVLIFSSESTDILYPRSDLLLILDKLVKGENIIFTKFGDGEYQCMMELCGANCDGDTYHSWLGQSLRKSLVQLATKKNVFLGKWDANIGDTDPEAGIFFEKILRQAKSQNYNWVHYHLLLNDDLFFNYKYMYEFCKFIKGSCNKKILVCNEKNNRLKEFFEVDIVINIPSKNWSYQYDVYRSMIEKHVQKNAILLIAGGLCSKVLINDMTNNYDMTCIDIGSGFDLLGSKIQSRNHLHGLQKELDYYSDLIPKNWVIETSVGK